MLSLYEGFPYPDSSILYTALPKVIKCELLCNYILSDGFLDSCKITDENFRHFADVGPCINFAGYLVKIYYADDGRDRMRPRLLGYQHGN